MTDRIYGNPDISAEGYVVVDNYFGKPYIDQDEIRESPSPHRFVHGGFENTDTRFAFYFPRAESYRGRMFQPLEGGHGGNEVSFGGGILGEMFQRIALSESLGGYTQSVLALGDGCRTPDFRDVITPTPPPGSATYSRGAADQRAKAFVDYVLRRSPGLLQAHPYFDRLGDSEAEDEFLYSHDFNMIYPLHYLKVPSLPQPGIPADPDAALAFHRNMLKQLQWQRPTERWVGKGVLHQHLMPSLLKTYPDAICFWLHRPPEQYVASLFELLELQYGPFNDGSYKFDPQARLDSLKAGVERYMKLPEFHSSQVHHIPFRKMVADPINTLGGIFEEHGIPFSQAYQQRLKERMASPDFKGDRHGKYHYSLEKFGLTVEQVREMFTEYCAYFDM